MAPEAETLVTSGRRSLETGDWEAAREAFGGALDGGDDPDVLDGLADALWWLGEAAESVALRERAYAALRRRGGGDDAAHAADIALSLSVHYAANLGNEAASAGWLGRAARLVEELDLDEVRGWVLLLQGHSSADPAEAESLARASREHAVRAGDLDLELCALAQVGAALVRQGRVEEGLASLDEAMAGSLGGEGSSFDTVVFTSCNMIGSCTACAEFERAVQWISAADRFTRRYGCPFLYVYCRTLYGGVLIATGDWAAAEEQLEIALREARGGEPVVHAGALAALAELRLAQGRIEEAEQLLAGFEDQDAAAPVVASLQLARGDHAAAAATAERALRAAAGDRLEGALLAEVLGEANVAAGDHDAASARGRELARSGASAGCELIRARGERLLGRSLAAGDPGADGVAEARRSLEDALARFARLQMPYEAARTRRLLAESLRAEEPAVAQVESRAALEAFERLGAGGDADAAAALLRDLGVKAARAGPKGIGTLTKREHEVLGLLGEGLSNPEIAERLFLSRKTVEHHVAHVLMKLDVRNRAEAAAAAVRGRAEGG